MYFDFLVKIPDAAGKITRRQKGDSVYINYEYGREYDPERQFNIPRRVTIGKQIVIEKIVREYYLQTILSDFLLLFTV